MPYKNKEQQREYQREWARRKGVAEAIKDRRKLTRRWLAMYKLALECVECGENHPATLDFHHLGDKSFGITAGAHDKTIEQLQEEIVKCEVLCANCHRKRHYKGPV